MKNPSPENSNKQPQFVVVYTTAGVLRAEIVKGKLESAGIPAMLKSEAQGVFPMTVDGMGKVQVLVPSEREQAAREILDQNAEDEYRDQPEM